jgi:hypothetical protein
VKLWTLTWTIPVGRMIGMKSLARYLAVLGVAVMGCSHTQLRDSSRASGKLDHEQVEMIVRESKAYAASQRPPLSGESVAEYYKGDGLGMNLCLSLMAGGHYTLTWNGCTGLYGMAVGQWRKEGSRLMLSPEEERDSLARLPIRSLEVHYLKSKVLFVADEDRERFEKDGPNRLNCFRDFRTIDFSSRR